MSFSTIYMFYIHVYNTCPDLLYKGNIPVPSILPNNIFILNVYACVSILKKNHGILVDFKI